MEEEKMVKINLENENILDGFYNYLLSCGLSERTAIRHYNNIDTYIKWVILAVITIVVITVFVLLVNTILFRNDFNDIIKMIKERKNSNEK